MALLSDFAKQLIHQIRLNTHLGHRKLKELLRNAHYKIFHLGSLVDNMISYCSKPKGQGGLGVRLCGQQSDASWEIEYMEIKLGLYGYNYLLDFIDTFSGWVESFPTKKQPT